MSVFNADKIMNVAFIPVRGGSKSIHLKNIKEICGKPLAYWVILAASQCTYIDKVYVATDSEIIKKTLQKYQLDKVEIIGRSEQSATDTATTESAMLEFAQQYEFDNIVLIQATSPLLSSEDLNKGFELFKRRDTDSVLSVVRQKRFCWSVDSEGIARPINYDVFHRPRRQEFDGYLVENGAFYITSKELLEKSGNRISGKIRIAEMPEDSFVEIDEPDDFLIVERLMKKNHKVKSKKIKMFLTDCDGCLTDGGMYYSENGEESKKFNTKDGMGLSVLREHGIITGIVTGENTQCVSNRAKKLKLNEVHLGVKNKLEVVTKIAQMYGVSLEEIVYVGDDLNDLDVISKVGYGCSVGNAVEKVKEHAYYVSEKTGGEGAIREIIEYFWPEFF